MPRKHFWKAFNDLALSLDRLQQEIGLSKRAARQVFERRTSAEFASQADIDAIDGLAKTPLQKIKKYLRQQQCYEPKLPGMISVEPTLQQEARPKNLVPKQKRKGIRPKLEQPDLTLFTPQQVAS